MVTTYSALFACVYYETEYRFYYFIATSSTRTISTCTGYTYMKFSLSQVWEPPKKFLSRNRGTKGGGKLDRQGTWVQGGERFANFLTNS